MQMLKKTSENKSPSENSVRTHCSLNEAIPALQKGRISSVARALLILLWIYYEHLVLTQPDALVNFNLTHTVVRYAQKVSDTDGPSWGYTSIYQNKGL